MTKETAMKKTRVLVIDPETGGGVPVNCELKIEKDKLIVSNNARNGFIISVRLEDIMDVMNVNQQSH